MAKVIIDQKKAYRKGMVLGFTMAEISIMLLFCILLAMAFVVDTQEERIQKTQLALSQSSEELQKLVEVKEAVNLVLGTLKDERSKESFFQELRRARDSAEEVRWLRESLGDETKGSDSLAPIRTAITMGRAQGIEEKEVITQLISNAEYGRAIRESLKNSPLGAEPAEKIAVLARSGEDQPPGEVECQVLKLEKERLKGQVANIQSRLSTLGRGTEMPACWANAQTGKPEYIFKVDLTPQGLLVHNKNIPHRSSEQSQLPISGIVFDQPVTRTAFRDQTSAIAEWSRANNCRFFVEVRDLTGDRDKDLYKSMLRAVEEHFYKLEVR